MALQTIESKDVTLGELFGGFFVVPNFQREYVWGTDEVRQLLEDIYNEFSASDRDPDSEYFIGTIVSCLADEGVYQLIDGQQRMTTAYLALCAIRDHIKKIAANEIEALKPQIAATSSDRKGKDVFRYRVALQYEDSCGILEAIAAGNELPTTKNGTRSVRNITNAYEVIRSFLEEHCKDEAAVRRFYAYFTRNVKLIRVKTISVTHALKIFETINDRGLGLDSMDLLKNLIFMQTSMEEFDKLKVRWKRLVDILDKGREKPLRFLRYFIFAKYDVDRLREDEIYDWFVKNEKKCGYKKKAFNFVDELTEAAESYTRFVKGENTDATPNRYLVNIKAMSGAARQHLILLLAGSHLSDSLFSDLCREIENLFFAYVITHEPTREFERKFAQWTKHLREVRDQSSLKGFLDAYFSPEKANLAARFELAILQLKSDSLQQYRLRYVLAKLTQFINEIAWGEGTEGDLSKFLESSVHIEHVLPQTPDKKALAEFDKPEEADDYIGRLGNLALAEDTINESLGNRPFSKKRPEYTHSKFLLTRLLSGKVTVGKKTSVNRAIDGIPIFDHWTSEAVDERQKSMTKLAMKVWEMPRPKRQSSTLEKEN